MFALRQIIDDPGDYIPVPAELKHRRIEIIYLLQDAPPAADVPETQEGIQDPGIMAFFGSMPDLPEREPQAASEQRESLD